MRDISGNREEDLYPPRDEQPTFEDLMHMAGQPARTTLEADQWQLLLRAVGGLSSALPLDDKLARIVQAAVDLTGARYGALTLVDSDEHPPLRVSLRAHGVAEADSLHVSGSGNQSRLAHLPATGTDGLATLRDLRQSAALRPTSTVIEARVQVGDRVFGTLHLSEKGSGPAFTEHDEQIGSTLAGAAGVAIENARLHEQVAGRERWLAAASGLFRGESDNSALQLVADWARELSGADAAWVVAGTEPGELRLRAVSGFEAEPEDMSALDFSTSLARCAGFCGRVLKVNNLAEHSRSVDVSAALGFGPMGPALIVPICGSRGLEAVVTLAWRDDPAEAGDDAAEDARVAGLRATLAEQAPVVLHVAQSGQDEQRLAVLQERDRIARDLHDLVIQQLFALGLELQGISWLHDPEEIARRLGRTTDEIDATIRDVRRTIFSLGPMTDDSDPSAAVLELVDRAARTMKVRPTLQFRGPVRSVIGRELLPDILAVLSEALSNVVRHAEASTCAVEVSVGDEITVRVTDDGKGIPDAVPESGLANVRGRAQRRGGQLSVASARGLGTSLVWSVPLT